MKNYYFKLSTAILLLLALFCAAFAFFTRFSLDILNGHTTYRESRFWGMYDVSISELPAQDFVDATLLYGSVDQLHPKTKSMFYVQLIGKRDILDLQHLGTTDKEKAQTMVNRIQSSIENRAGFSETRYYAFPLLYVAGFLVLLAVVNQIDAIKMDEKWPP